MNLNEKATTHDPPFSPAVKQQPRDVTSNVAVRFIHVHIKFK